MKLNKKNKGKVHPSPPSSSSSSSKDTVSALKLLPAAIFTLISVLSLEDREVLAYMITRSIKATANPSLLLEENRRRRSKRQTLAEHQPPAFDCGCFDCYTSYWIRWDSSPNRELIHQAIEAFEEHLASGEKSKRTGRGKRREKTTVGRRSGGSESDMLSELEIPAAMDSPGPAEWPESVEFPLEDSARRSVEEEQKLVEPNDEAAPETAEVESSSSSSLEESEAVARTAVAGGNHKGLARKVLPDVIGLINSRLWSLWSPNV